MPPKQKITEDAWELHRAELRKLYLSDDMSLGMIRTKMDEDYGFCPSKSQYETAFKKWNFRKNLSHSEWEFVGHRVKKRKADGKESEVHLDGALISSKRVKKELNRHITPSYLQLYATAPSPQTPPNLAVRTPDTAIQTPKNPETFEIRLENLPWFQFQEMFEPYAQDLAASMFDGGDHQARSIGPALDFSAQGGRDQLESQAMVAAPVTSLVFAGFIPSSIKQWSVEYIPTVHSLMQAISLERNSGDFLSSIQKLLGPFNHDALTEFLKSMAYLSSNNMLSDCQSNQFLRWVVKTNNSSTLREFFSVKTPTIEAFARCVFESALRLGDASVLRILLKVGVNPDPPTKCGQTPLQVVVGNGNVELARILLDEGVDVNTLSSDGRKTALHFAVEGTKKAHIEGDDEMIQMLLNAGADINPASAISVLRAAFTIHEGSVKLETIRRLLNAGANVEAPFYCTRRTALQAAAENGDVERARFLLDAGADVNAPAVLPNSDSGTMLQVVVGQEYPIELTQLLLNKGADVNAPAGWGLGTDDWCSCWEPDEWYPGITALQGAASSGSVEMVQMLLDAGADVNAQVGFDGDGDDFAYGMTALQIAVQHKNAEIVRILLDAGAEVNAQANYDDGDGYGYGVTALQVAVEAGSVELVRVLLEAGADVNAPGCSAISSAVQANNVPLIQVLMAAGADFENEGSQVLMLEALRNGDIDLLRHCLAAGANVNARIETEKTALQVAITYGRSDLVQVLIDAGADINAFSPEYGRAVLWTAVERDDIGLVWKLLDAGAKVDAIIGDPNNRYVTNALPLAAVLCQNDIEMVQLLIDAKADINASVQYWPEEAENNHPIDLTALVGAAWQENVGLVELLLAAGADVNARPQPSGGWTALQAAAHSGNTKLVRILLNARADINAPAHNTRGRTALQAAVVGGHTELARYLLEAGADANAPAAQCTGMTALQGAAIWGQLGIALMLIQAGADPNAPAAKHNGRTALQGAAEHGRLDVLQLLLNAGADIGGEQLARARELAEKNGHVVIAELLKQF